MTDPTSRRPITQADYDRAYKTVMALELKAVHDEGRPLWEILHDIHQDTQGPAPTVDLDDLIGDAAANREVHHALLLLEALARGKDTLPVHLKMAMTVCAAPGCPELTTGHLCLNCELDANPRG